MSAKSRFEHFVTCLLSEKMGPLIRRGLDSSHNKENSCMDVSQVVRGTCLGAACYLQLLQLRCSVLIRKRQVVIFLLPCVMWDLLLSPFCNLLKNINSLANTIYFHQHNQSQLNTPKSKLTPFLKTKNARHEVRREPVVVHLKDGHSHTVDSCFDYLFLPFLSSFLSIS